MGGGVGLNQSRGNRLQLSNTGGIEKKGSLEGLLLLKGGSWGVGLHERGSLGDFSLTDCCFPEKGGGERVKKVEVGRRSKRTERGVHSWDSTNLPVIKEKKEGILKNISGEIGVEKKGYYRYVKVEDERSGILMGGACPG